MVTGDNRKAALHVAAALDIPSGNVISEVLPQDKAGHVVAVRNSGRRCVAFVGDGINDGPALTEADVGVALGAGMHVAMECADVVLIRSHLADLVAMVSLAKVPDPRL